MVRVDDRISVRNYHRDINGAFGFVIADKSAGYFGVVLDDDDLTRKYHDGVVMPWLFSENELEVVRG